LWIWIWLKIVFSLNKLFLWLLSVTEKFKWRKYWYWYGVINLKCNAYIFNQFEIWLSLFQRYISRISNCVTDKNFELSHDYTKLKNRTNKVTSISKPVYFFGSDFRQACTGDSLTSLPWNLSNKVVTRPAQVIRYSYSKILKI